MFEFKLFVFDVDGIFLCMDMLYESFWVGFGIDLIVMIKFVFVNLCMLNRLKVDLFEIVLICVDLLFVNLLVVELVKLVWVEGC